MPADIAIHAEDLAKKYIISHQSDPSGHGVLREALTAKFKRALRPIRHIPGGGPGWSSQTREEFWALKNVGFDVCHGEVLGIIGRNGAGKSTLLKILSRITDPTEGRVELCGRVASLLEVGTGFHPELTGRENVYLNGAILGMTRSEIRTKFDEIVAFAGVERFLDTPVKRYSSGMYVRLAFAVAAHLEPDILIIDEVLAVGDAEFQRRCLGKMQDVSKHGRTVLFVSHNMLAVEQLCSRAICLEAGRIRMAGSARDVIANYLSNNGAEVLECFPESDPARVAEVQHVVLCSDDGKPLRQVTTADTAGLNIQLLVREPRPDLQIAFSVHDAYRTAIFASCPLDDGVQQPTQKGRHDFRVRFPGPIFLPQRYSITISVYSTRSIVFHDCAHALRFDVLPAASKIYSAAPNRVGLMQILCDWKHMMHDDPEPSGQEAVA
ncbi:MAG TPA: ABC transporter ATP-binding protein [Micropepsaceae bacterium]|nr:ABC transporter ATP-binding protein [Micropepsaceae bacterium]